MFFPLRTNSFIIYSFSSRKKRSPCHLPDDTAISFFISQIISELRKNFFYYSLQLTLSSRTGASSGSKSPKNLWVHLPRHAGAWQILIPTLVCSFLCLNSTSALSTDGMQRGTRGKEVERKYLNQASFFIIMTFRLQISKHMHKRPFVMG